MGAAAKHRHVYCKVSALVEGTGRRDGKAPRDVAFYEPVLDALWDAVRATLPTTTWLGSEALEATLDDPGLVAAYERDGRPVTTGLLAAARVSARLGAGAASSMRAALLAVGEGVARARGPFGRSISRQDADTLELLAEIMDLSDADPHRLFAFV